MNSLNSYKKVATLVPELSDTLVKQAASSDTFSTKSREDTIASAAMISYLTKVANQYVPEDDAQRVNRAVDLYGLHEEVRKTEDGMLKQAAQDDYFDTEDRLRLAESIVEEHFGTHYDLEKTASQAEALWDHYSDDIQSDTVAILSGNGFMLKQAAQKALISRYIACNKSERGFLKLANVVASSNVEAFDSEDHKMIANAVIELEKKAGLYGGRFNFYKEAFVPMREKVASYKVDLAKDTVGLDAIIALGKDNLSRYLGEETAKAITGKDLTVAKAAVESLPLDLKRVLENML